MIINLPLSFKEQVESFGLEIPDADAVLDKDTFQFDLNLCEEQQIDKIYEMLKPHNDARSIRVAINAYKRDRNDRGSMKVTLFEQLASDIQQYLTTDATRGWIYRISEFPEPEVVTHVRFSPYIRETKNRPGQDEYITIYTEVNHLGRTRTRNHSIKGHDGKAQLDVIGALEKIGFQKETDELHQLYDEQLERFRDIRPRFGEQLILTRDHEDELNDEEDDDGNSYYRRRRKRRANLKEHGLGKLVHNQPMESRGMSIASYKDTDPNEVYLAADLRAYTRKNKTPEGAFKRAPHVMCLKTYHLDKHVETEIHVMEVEVYVYNKEIRNQLVLPGMYNDVLDVLTSGMKVEATDIIEGKSGGNTILLAGPPGLGKTLTAEVYAEFREVPLLKVHSGQLGTNAKAIEQSLTKFYKMASDWDCPILLDEFDVFGRARGVDLEQNAVVAVFLRTLEYQANTLFLTTNRADDMDDAILSRCMAIIKFELPKEAELRKIWKTLRSIILPSVSDQLLDEMMDQFMKDCKKMSGRDVKNTLQLAARYAATGKEVTKELLMTCAGFRGI